jgi:hypothetical protein
MRHKRYEGTRDARTSNSRFMGSGSVHRGRDTERADHGCGWRLQSNDRIVVTGSISSEQSRVAATSIEALEP